MTRYVEPSDVFVDTGNGGHRRTIAAIIGAPLRDHTTLTVHEPNNDDDLTGRVIRLERTYGLIATIPAQRILDADDPEQFLRDWVNARVGALDRTIIDSIVPPTPSTDPRAELGTIPVGVTSDQVVESAARFIKELASYLRAAGAFDNDGDPTPPHGTARPEYADADGYVKERQP